MSKPFPASKLDEIVAAVGRHPEGATLIDIAIKLSWSPTQRSLQRWLNALVKQNRVVRVGGSHRIRYKLPDESELANVPYLSVIGQSIWRLVNQPLAERAPADYRRLAMDGYQPNQSFYLSEQVRTSLRAPVGAATGAAVAPAWRDQKVYTDLLVNLAWRSRWLKCQVSTPPMQPLGMPDVQSWLAQPESLNARSLVQLVWNNKAAMDVLLSKAPNVTLTYDVLTAVYGALTKGMQGAGSKREELRLGRLYCEPSRFGCRRPRIARRRTRR